MKNLIKIAFCFIAFWSNGQIEVFEIKATINRFFEGMESKDTIKIRTAIDSDGAFLKSVAIKKDGNTMLLSETIEEFFNQVIDMKDIKIEEKLLSFDIKVDDAMAMAWTEYQFFVNDEFSHCGVNVFILIKRHSQWKIIGITDTRRKSGCLESKDIKE